MMNMPAPEPIFAETRTKRQHYVPRHLLKHFAIDGFVQRFDLETQTIEAALPKNVAWEQRYYDVADDNKALSAETWLGQVIESPAARVIDRLVRSPAALLDLTTREQRVLARFIAAQRFRVPAFRSSIEASLARVNDEIAGMVSNALKFTVKADELHRYVKGIEPPSSIDQGTEASLSMLGQVRGFANLLLHKPWRIGRGAGPRRFYSSDSAIGAHLPAVRPSWSGGAFSEYEYYSPLSPDVLLWIAGDSYDSYAGANAIDLYGPRTVFDYSPWEVSYARHTITATATKYLFGKGPFVSKNCAIECLGKIDDLRVALAMAYKGYNPDANIFAGMKSSSASQ